MELYAGIDNLWQLKGQGSWSDYWCTLQALTSSYILEVGWDFLKFKAFGSSFKNAANTDCSQLTPSQSVVLHVILSWQHLKKQHGYMMSITKEMWLPFSSFRNSQEPGINDAAPEKELWLAATQWPCCSIIRSPLLLGDTDLDLMVALSLVTDVGI